MATLPTDGDELIGSPVRRGLIAWVLVTIPIAGMIGLLVDGERGYLGAWVVVSGLCVGPALVVGWCVCRRADVADRRFWQLWATAVVLMALSGTAVLVYVISGSAAWTSVSIGFTTAAGATFIAAVVQMMRSRSGMRALAIDAIETLMLATAIVAFVPLVLHDRSLWGPDAWFTIPSAGAGVALLIAFCGAIVLFRNLRSERRTVEGLGVALAGTSAVNCLAHMFQGMSGFTLPASPMLVLQTINLGLLLLLPAFVPKVSPVGLDRLSPQAQVRGWSLDTLALALLAPLLACTIVLHDAVAWALWYFVAVAVTLLVLATARGKLAQHETRRLYARVESAADDRQRLLADVLQSAENDRHRVAAQLHQQATSFYVTFSTYLRSTTGDGADVHPALQGVRDDLFEQAEAMRQLMLAVKPLEASRDDATDLGTTVAAFVDSLYGDGPAPAVVLDIDPDLELDWSSETIVLRILQEALRNIHDHAGARHIEVAIGVNDLGLVVRVRDDGAGFVVNQLLFESGIATMRTFAARADGIVTLYSRPGHGSTVYAQLGATPADEPGADEPQIWEPAGGPRPVLRLVPDDGAALGADDEH